MNDHSWPPAIPPPALPLQDRRLIKAVLKGKAAVWLAGIGILMSLDMMQGSDLFSYGSLDHPLPGYFVSTYLGLVCDLSGLVLGIVSRKTTVGKIGLILSFLALVSVPALVLAYHAHNGNWPWLTEDDCKCM